jgi:hypothetical protein
MVKKWDECGMYIGIHIMGAISYEWIDDEPLI